MTRQQKYRLKRRAEGRCGKEGCAELSGSDYYCGPHAEAEATRSREAYARRKAELLAELEDGAA